MRDAENKKRHSRNAEVGMWNAENKKTRRAYAWRSNLILLVLVLVLVLVNQNFK
jgi:hypothetical protein